MLEILLKDRFHAQIHEAVRDHVNEKRSEYDLTRRAFYVSEALSANVSRVRIMRASEITQEDDEVYFKLLVSAMIEIGDCFYGTALSEDVEQWFLLSCSARVRSAEIAAFCVDEIQIYNK